MLDPQGVTVRIEFGQAEIMNARARHARRTKRRHSLEIEGEQHIALIVERLRKYCRCASSNGRRVGLGPQEITERVLLRYRDGSRRSTEIIKCTQRIDDGPDGLRRHGHVEYHLPGWIVFHEPRIVHELPIAKIDGIEYVLVVCRNARADEHVPRVAPHERANGRLVEVS